MDKKELARLINGREYGYEPFRDVWQVAKEAGLVIVSGASDDLMEFYQDDSKRANYIEAFWCDKTAFDENGNIIAWTYKTDIPHETFMIYEDGAPYCRGIVFNLADVKKR